MKSIDDCLDDIQDDTYAYTNTLLEFVDADVAEGLLKSISQAVESGNAASLPFFAQSLGTEINNAMRKRAETMRAKSATPYDREIAA